MKVFNYVILIIGLIAIFEMAGIPTGVAAILNFVGIDLGTGVTTTISPFYIAVLAILSAAIVTGIAVGFITKSPSENYVIVPLIIGSLVFFGGSFASIINFSRANHAQWVSYIITLVLGILSVGYIISLVEFFRGTD